MKKRKTALKGYSYDAARRRVELDGYVAGTNGATRRRRTITNVTEAQALAAYAQFRDELATGRAIDGPLTLKQFVDGYYEQIAANHAESTKDTQKVIIKSHLVRYFGGEKLSDITSIRVSDFVADMKMRGRRASYINDAVRVLKMLLRQAVERNVIPEYPLTKRVPKERETLLRQELDRVERARYFSAFDDEAAFCARIEAKQKRGAEKESTHFNGARRFGGGMRGDSEAAHAYFERFRELRDFFIVAVETGLRIYSDLRNLRWSSVNFEAGFIRVVMQKTRMEAVIPISRMCGEALRRCHERQRTSDYVFVDKRRVPFSPTRIRRTFVLAKILAGIERPFRPHDLRHTFGCRLADGNISLQKIAKALGHASTRMAERYARPADEAMREVTGALDDDTLLPQRPIAAMSR